MHVPADAGFAIAPLETAFAGLLLEMADGDASAVHFAYPSIGPTRPRSLPEGVRAVAFIPEAGEEASRAFLAGYAREHQIDFVLFFDKQPVSPLFGDLRRAGVRCQLAYWGAQISARSAWWRLGLKRLEVALSRSRLDGLIFESQAMADLARFGRGVPERMIDVVPLGVDISKFSPIRTDYAHRAFSIDAGKRIVVYAGHMEARKGVATLVKAAVELIANQGRRDLALLIFGDRPGESEAFRHLYAGLGIDDSIFFAGYRSDLHECFPGCFAGVIPSVGWDSFPRTSVELAACGLPLVVSRLGGLPECVVEGATGLIFEPGDHFALSKQLVRLLEDPAAAEAMGRAGRERCEREFTLDVQAERLRNVFKRRLAMAKQQVR